MINKSSILFASIVLLVLHQPVHAQVSLGTNRHLRVSAAGTPAENCQAIRDVLVSIKFKSSITTPYLVELEPGVYDCGVTDTELRVYPYITIQGAGINATTVKGTMTRQFGTFVMDDGVELRSMTIRDEGGPTESFTVGVSLLQGVGRLTHVRVFAGIGTSFSIGVIAANVNTRLDIKDSIIEGEKDAVSPENTADIRVSNSQLIATDASTLVGLGSGTIKCVNSYDTNHDPLLANCEP